VPSATVLKRHAALTIRFDSSMSILLPSTTNGKFSGSCGEACVTRSARGPITPGPQTPQTTPVYVFRPGASSDSEDLAHLDQELVPPPVERLEALGAVDVVDQDAAVRAAIECHAERLEAFLSGGVPELRARSGEWRAWSRVTATARCGARQGGVGSAIRMQSQ
jgi:hypothetical protein